MEGKAKDKSSPSKAPPIENRSGIVMVSMSITITEIKRNTNAQPVKVNTRFEKEEPAQNRYANPIAVKSSTQK